MSSHVATGSVTISGTAVYCAVHFISSQYSIGDLVYIATKARKGVLERVCIKKIRVLDDEGLLYQDTLNALFEEDQLVSHEEALELAASYYAAQIGKIDDLIDDLT